MIAIKGAKMPKDCYECPMVCLSDPDELFCVALKSRPICEYVDYEKRPEWCPLVEVVEVVRCKDCEWRNKAYADNCVAYHAFWDFGDDGFCSNAKRKIDEEDNQ